MKVALFVTCLVDQLFPQVGEAMVTVLRRAGMDVDFQAALTCCGQIARGLGLMLRAPGDYPFAVMLSGLKFRSPDLITARRVPDLRSGSIEFV